MPTPKILRVVCRGTAELDAKQHFYKVIAPYIETLSRLGAIPRCNPTTLTTRNLDRLKKSFEEDIATDLSALDSIQCRIQLEVLFILYRGLELFELQSSSVALKFLSDMVDGSKAAADVRFELMQNDRFKTLRDELTSMETSRDALNDSMMGKVLKLADILEKHLCQTTTASRILIAVPSAAVCEEVNRMLASLSTLVSSYVYDTSKYTKNTLKDFLESNCNCIVVISNEENLKGQNIPLVGISLAICLDVQKNVFKKPPYWQGSIYMLLTDLENKSFHGEPFLTTSPKKPAATLKRALANQASRGKKAFLNKEELAYFDRHIKSSTKFVLPSRETESDTRSQAPNAVSLSVTKWRPWQNKLQETFHIGHSADCEALVEVFDFCDKLSAEPRPTFLENYEQELASHFRVEDVHMDHQELSATKTGPTIGTDMLSFDFENIDLTFISPELDKYVLDSAEKIASYLSELDLGDVDKAPTARREVSNSMETLPDKPIASQERPRSIADVLGGTPEHRIRHVLTNSFARNESSPLAMTERVPTASTPFAGSNAPVAHFKLTPISHRQPSTPISRLRDVPRRSELDSTPESSRLGLTALVNIVQKKKNQKNLQFFFPKKENQQAQLSDLIEAVGSSSEDEIQETTLRQPKEGADNEAKAQNKRDNDVSREELPFSDVCDQRAVSHWEKYGAPAEDGQGIEPRNAGERRESPHVSEVSGLPQSLTRTEEDNEGIFEDTDVPVEPPGGPEGAELIEIEDSPQLFRNDQNPGKGFERKANGVGVEKSLKFPKVAQFEPKRRIRSVFDALDDQARKEESPSAQNALLEIINNIPKRDQEVDVIKEEFKVEEVGDILPVEVHNEVKPPWDSEENSDDLFDCVEEPFVAPESTGQQDSVLEKLLEKAERRELKVAMNEPGQSRKASCGSREAISSKHKRFCKQKLRDIVQHVDVEERRESSPESIKMTCSAPSATAKTTLGVEFPQDRSRSQREYAVKNRSGTPLIDRNLSNIFESRSSKARKRERSSPESSDESALFRRRKKKPIALDGSSTLKPESAKSSIKKPARSEYFNDEAEVDSIESVSADEHDEPNAYEMNSFVDDGETVEHSQGMYHRLNRHWSPPKRHRQPSKQVAYEDCFSQGPPSEDDSYGNDSFVEVGSVADVTLPAEITVIQTSPKAGKVKKKKGARRVFLCDESSSGDEPQVGGENRAKPSEDSQPKGKSRNLEAAIDSTAGSKTGVSTQKNVILVNMALMEILPEILVGLQRTFDTCLIEPIDMLALGNHPVDLYLSDLCIKFLTLEQLRSEKKKTLESVHRFKLACESTVLVVITSATDDPSSDGLIKAVLEISEVVSRTFFVKNQVELLMLLKCIAKKLLGNEWLLDYLESGELHRLLSIQRLNILTSAALLRAKHGKARDVMQTSSLGEIEEICGVSGEFARLIFSALRSS